MKKFLLFLAAGLLSAATWAGAVPAPVDARGNALTSIDWVGALPCSIDGSTGTTAILCGSVGRGVVYGVIATSITLSDFLVFRDTNTANLTSSTAAIVYNSPQGQNISTANPWNPYTNLIKLPVPIQFRNGIGVNDAAAPTSNGISRWTILYRPLTATE